MNSVLLYMNVFSAHWGHALTTNTSQLVSLHAMQMLNHDA